MRKFTTTFLVALLTFSVGFGTVAAKPKDDNPGKGKDNLRLSLDCTVDNVASYAGTYTSGTDPIPDWLMADASSAITNAGTTSLIGRLGDLQVGDVSWQVIVTPDGVSEGGTVQVVAVASLK